MICPKCGSEISVRGSRYDLRHGCPVCGWARGRSKGWEKTRGEGQYEVSYAQWVVCWILAVAFVFGPYVTIWVLQPAWATPGFFFKYYWIGWGIYLVLALVLTPNPNMENIGYFHGLIDKPFDFSDDYNRFLVFLTIVLTPGKIVIGALWRTPRYLKLALGRRATGR